MPPHSVGMCGSQSPHSCAALRISMICSTSPRGRARGLDLLLGGPHHLLDELAHRAAQRSTSSGKLKSIAMGISSVPASMPHGPALRVESPEAHAARIRLRRTSSSVAASRDGKLLLPVHDQLAVGEAPDAVGAAAVAVLVADAAVVACAAGRRARAGGSRRSRSRRRLRRRRSRASGCGRRGRWRGSDLRWCAARAGPARAPPSRSARSSARRHR